MSTTTTRHGVAIDHSPAWDVPGDVAASRWACDCGVHGEWFYANAEMYGETESDYADERARVAAILDGRSHGALGQPTVVGPTAGSAYADGVGALH